MVDAFQGLMPLCDPAAGIFGAEGGGEAQGRARAGLLWCRFWLLSSVPCTQ